MVAPIFGIFDRTPADPPPQQHHNHSVRNVRNTRIMPNTIPIEFDQPPQFRHPSQERLIVCWPETGVFSVIANSMLQLGQNSSDMRHFCQRQNIPVHGLSIYCDPVDASRYLHIGMHMTEPPCETLQYGSTVFLPNSICGVRHLRWEGNPEMAAQLEDALFFDSEKSCRNFLQAWSHWHRKQWNEAATTPLLAQQPVQRHDQTDPSRVTPR